MSRSEEEFKDFVASKLRDHDAKHSAHEDRLSQLGQAIATLGQAIATQGAQLTHNTNMTNQIRSDTADIREATIGMKWLGKVSRWFMPVLTVAGLVWAFLTKKGM